MVMCEFTKCLLWLMMGFGGLFADSTFIVSKAQFKILRKK